MLDYKDSLSYGVAICLALIAAWIDVLAVRLGLGILGLAFFAWPVLHKRFNMSFPLTLFLICVVPSEN